jgi:serine/threonine protein phosphatase PrpC
MGSKMPIICQHCKSENKANAKFCLKCGKDLLNAPAKTDPVLRLLRVDTRVSNYQVIGIIYNRADYNQYEVTDIAPPELRLAVCDDSSCGAYHQPDQTFSESICTVCGKPLNKNKNLLLTMIERTDPPREIEQAFLANSLTHGRLCVPLKFFQQDNFSYLILPKWSELPGEMEIPQLLKDSVDLALALEVIHKGGVSFNGHIMKRHLGIFNNHLSWVNFDNCSLSPYTVPASSVSSDVIGLARLVYRFLSNQNDFSPMANQSQSINNFFKKALQDQAITTVAAYAEELTNALAEQQDTPPGSLEFEVGGLSHVGMDRQLNEDSLMTLTFNLSSQSSSQPRGVYAVADGMGGHAAGEVASRTVVETLSQETAKTLLPAWSKGELVDLEVWIKDAVLAANKAVYTRGKGAGSDMGSTLVIAVLDGATLHLANVGDSRIYLVNKDNIQQLSTDHSLVERLVASGQITREEARTHDKKNVIYRTMGDKLNLEVDKSKHTLVQNDYLLLCSDGLSGMVDDPYLQNIIMNAPSPQQACEDLIKAANAAGGEDNITAIVVKIIATFQ